MATLLKAINDASFELALLPLALFATLVAVGGIRGRGLPTWLSLLSLVAAAGLLFSGAVGVATGNAVGFVVFLLWVLLASIVLTLRARRANAPEAAASR